MNRTYISDSVVDGSGKPIVGALVTLLRASDYSSPPAADPGPGSANYIAQTSTGAGGAFSFDHIPPDDYHIMVQYAGQTQFRYNVSAFLRWSTLPRKKAAASFHALLKSSLLARTSASTSSATRSR